MVLLQATVLSRIAATVITLSPLNSGIGAENSVLPALMATVFDCWPALIITFALTGASAKSRPG